MSSSIQHNIKNYNASLFQGITPVFRSLQETLKGDQVTYFHSHTATAQELDVARGKDVIFEIDLAWASSPFLDNRNIRAEEPYIGHPEKFYTEMGKPFPADNVSLEEFKIFLRDNPSVKVLLDVKDEATFSYLEKFIKEVGSERCIVHAFIKDWTLLPEGMKPEPHWDQEDIDLAALNAILEPLQVPLIANCRGFSDQHVEKTGRIQKMSEDGRKYRSIVCLGLYYPKAVIPEVDFLHSINKEGFHAWMNANDPRFQEKAGGIRYIAMKDELY